MTFTLPFYTGQGKELVLRPLMKTAKASIIFSHIPGFWRSKAVFIPKPSRTIYTLSKDFFILKTVESFIDRQASNKKTY